MQFALCQRWQFHVKRAGGCSGKELEAVVVEGAQLESLAGGIETILGCHQLSDDSHIGGIMRLMVV